MWLLIKLEKEHFSSCGCMCTFNRRDFCAQVKIEHQHSNPSSCIRTQMWGVIIKISEFSSLYWRGEERVKNEHEPIGKSLYSLPLLWAVTDSILHQGTAAFGAHGARAAYTSSTGLLSLISCQKHWSTEPGSGYC